jgi:hypothetical protein
MVEQARYDSNLVLIFFHPVRSPCPDDACIDQFLNFLADHRVLQMVLQRPRISLGLLQYLLNYRVIHDALTKWCKYQLNLGLATRFRSVVTHRNLRIAHSSLHCLFLAFVDALTEQRLLALQLLLLDFGSVFMLRIVLLCLLDSLNRLGIVSHREKDERFADVSLHYVAAAPDQQNLMLKERTHQTQGPP